MVLTKLGPSVATVVISLTSHYWKVSMACIQAYLSTSSEAQRVTTRLVLFRSGAAAFFMVIWSVRSPCCVMTYQQKVESHSSWTL